MRGICFPDADLHWKSDEKYAILKKIQLKKIHVLIKDKQPVMGVRTGDDEEKKTGMVAVRVVYRPYCVFDAHVVPA